ncbi:hypothetical protein BGW41_002518 [Actinomortierella wolfii]|nr:hypothetical protein BGW41_002518 [Actinomortierella wolfii]
MTVFEFNIDPDRNALIRRALAKRILRQREIEEEEASTEEDESFLGRPIARRKQSSSRQGSQGINDDAQQTNTTAISVTVTQPNGATTTASRAATAAAATPERHANGPKVRDDSEHLAEQDEMASVTGASKEGTPAASIGSPSGSTLGDGMKHKSRWKSEYLRATSETSQTDRGSSPAETTISDVAGEGAEGEEGKKATDGDDDKELVQPSDTEKSTASVVDHTAPDAAAFPSTMPRGADGGEGGANDKSDVAQPEVEEQAILARLDELRKEKTRLFQQFKNAIARKAAPAATAGTVATVAAPVQTQALPTTSLEGTATSNPDAMNTAIKDDTLACQLSRNEVEVSHPSEQKIDIGVQESRKKLEVEIPRDRHSPGAEVPPSLSSATSTASSVAPYSPINSHPSQLPSDGNFPSLSPSTTASTTSSSSPQLLSSGKSSGTKRPRSDSPPPLSSLSQEGGGNVGGTGGGAGSRRRPRHFDDRPPRGPAGGAGGGGSDPALRKPLPTYPGLPSKPQIRQPYPGGSNKYGDSGRDRGRGPYGSSISGGGANGSSSSLEGKHGLPRRPFLDENRNRGGGGAPSGSNAGSSGSGQHAGSGGVSRGTGVGGGSYARGGGGHNSLPDRPLLDYRPVLGGPTGRPLPFSRSMMQMPRPGGFLPGRPPTLMRPVWPRRGSRS